MAVDSAATDAAANPSRLILASGSPRRQSLLREAGYEFVVHPADIDEQAYGAGLLPIDLARKLAIVKAEAIASKYPDDVVLAADTVVAFGDQILGKPKDADDARRMLWLLSGTTHIVITGVSVQRRRDGVERSARVLSAVRMNVLTTSQIETYVASNDWQGKAGGYGIQDADPFVQRLSGCHSNIVGLPMTTTGELLKSLGVVPRN